MVIFWLSEDSYWLSEVILFLEGGWNLIIYFLWLFYGRYWKIKK